MQRWISSTVVLSILAFFAGSGTAAEEPVQTLEWNVFLGNWQLLGPFPKDDADPTGLDTKFVNDEANLHAGQVCFYKNKLYTWQPYKERLIQFRQALKVHGPPGDNVVAYAWTQITSPVAQKAVLAVGYDDTFVAWVNGQEVCRGTDNWASSLDQATGEVELRAGVNTVLLKVGNGIRLWDAAARFLPAGLEKPLFTFRCEPGGNIPRLPLVQIELLDAQGTSISEHRCSGSRKSWPGVSGYYALYASASDPSPSAARFVIRERGFREVDLKFPWKTVQSGNIVLKLLADRPLELLIVDQKTRQPITGAEVRSGSRTESTVSNAEGRITLPEFNSMANLCWIAARGYAARQVNLAWPRGNIQRVELTPGGRMVSGTIRSTTGEPLAGATITCGLAGYSPKAVTDENGQFELFGLPETTDAIYPIVTCPGFMTKDGFLLSLEEGTLTKVDWELSPDATSK